MKRTKSNRLEKLSGLFVLAEPGWPDNDFVRGRCPFHDDRHPSATLLIRNKRPARFFCFAGCGKNLPVLSFERVSDWEVRIVVLRSPDDGVRHSGIPNASAAESRPEARFRRPAADDPVLRGLLDLEALDSLKTAAVLEAEQIIEGRFREDAGAVAFWSAFMRVKRVPESWLSLPNRPLCGIGLHFRLHGIEENGHIVLMKEHIHIRTNTDFQKSFFHRPFVRREGENGGNPVPLYSPLGFPPPTPHPPVVVVEAPQHAVRIAVITADVFPVAALGISNIPRLAAMLQRSGFPPAVVVADEPFLKGAASWSALVMDLDAAADAMVLSALRRRARV